MEPLRMLRPPAPTTALLTWRITVDTDLAAIREGITGIVAAPATDTGAIQTAQVIGLVATELAGNALRHGQPPLTVRLFSDDDCYILDVSDHGVHYAPRPAGHREVFGVGGRGLMISIALAEQVGWYATATTKHIWASFPRTRPPHL
jgi:serine/threonine-protein kinase RsbW